MGGLQGSQLEVRGSPLPNFWQGPSQSRTKNSTTPSRSTNVVTEIENIVAEAEAGIDTEKATKESIGIIAVIIIIIIIESTAPARPDERDLTARDQDRVHLAEIEATIVASDPKATLHPIAAKGEVEPREKDETNEINDTNDTNDLHGARLSIRIHTQRKMFPFKLHLSQAQ